MNQLERFRAVMQFQPVDRLPRVEWASWWDKTVERWHGEGLAVTERYAMYDHFGLDPYWQYWFGTRRPGYPEMPHGQGAVRDLADYERLKAYLYPPVDRAMAELAAWGAAQREGHAVVWVTIEGFFWFARGLFGIEPHLYAFYDQPELMHRINADLAAWQIDVLRQLAKVCPPAFMTFAEDMSYNHGPMLSKTLFDEFLAPYYRQVIPVLEEMGTLPIVDTDGNVTAMVPWLEGAGLRGVLPLERQAKVDAAEIRAAHPRLLMIGHYDKMVMPHGEAAMRQEFERLVPVMRSGGFIPSVDHQTPPGVSLEAYRVYLRLLEEYTAAAHP